MPAVEGLLQAEEVGGLDIIKAEGGQAVVDIGDSFLFSAHGFLGSFRLLSKQKISLLADHSGLAEA